MMSEICDERCAKLERKIKKLKQSKKFWKKAFKLLKRATTVEKNIHKITKWAEQELARTSKKGPK